MGKVFGVNVVVGIPSFGMVSTHFLQARNSQQFPLVSSAVDKFVLNKPIAEAPNEIVQYALDQGANYIFWLDDDVIAPPDAFLKMYMQQKDIVNGVYWSKSNPPMPLLFRNHLEGPYLDWHVGDFIEIDAAGNGLTLVKTDVYRKISETVGGPWYSTEYGSFKGVKSSPANNTEDLYFYWKAKQAGFKIWADTSIQALHYEKNSQMMYGPSANAPQMNPAWAIIPQGKKKIADLGSGPTSPFFQGGKTVSFDIREEVKPDVVCDLRKIPVPDEEFDVVFSSHTLEHFSWSSIQKVLKEWSRILKVGGELQLVVPNLRYSAKRILNDEMLPFDFWVLYGEQDYPKNFHAAGFTPKVLTALVESLGMYENIEIKEGDIDGPPNPHSWNLQLKATKIKHPEIDNITPDYIEAPVSEPTWWPVRMQQQYNTREMKDEILKDKLKWIDREVTIRENPEIDLFTEGFEPIQPVEQTAEIEAITEAPIASVNVSHIEELAKQG